MLHKLSVLTVGVALLLLAANARGVAQSAAEPPANREIDAAFVASHNLDHDQALGHARQAVRLDPDNSRTHRALASVIWLDLLYWRGGMTVDSFLGNLSSMQLNLPKPDAQLADEFKGAVNRAIELAEKRLKQRASDVDAMYDTGAAYGVLASYIASIEGSVTGAFRHAKRAFELHNEVLKRDPKRASAGIVVGGYRYVIASQPVVVQWFAFLAGFAGDKGKAIALLEQASHDPSSRVDGKTALVLIYSREGRHTEAMRLAGELAAELPDNRMFVLEQGSAAIRAGHKDSEAILTRGIAQFEKDKRPKLPGERALWFYKRGLSRLNLNRPPDATAADLRQALASSPEAWVEGRTRVALGQLADLAGRRAEAVTEYTKAKAICGDRDQMCAQESRKFLKQPFSFEHR